MHSGVAMTVAERMRSIVCKESAWVNTAYRHNPSPRPSPNTVEQSAVSTVRTPRITLFIL